MAEDKDLRNVFRRYEKLLFKAANSTKEENVYSFTAEFYHKVDVATQSFKQLAKRYMDKAIPEVAMSSAAEATLLSAGAYHETANVKLTTYVQMVSRLTATADGFKDRIQARITEDEKSGKVTTVSALKDYINTELKSGRSLTVTYSNGTQMPTEKYAEMLARTTRTETQNIAMIGKALDDGNDLVECSTVTPTCDLCALYQGRIYSVSGRTPGYPSLYETAFKHGYSIIHPNCRHQFFPYNPKFHTEAERQALEEGTRRPWIGGQQGEAARAEYAKSQMQMRRWNKELNEFAQMKQRFGDNAPYKTLGAFRRAYRSEEGSLPYAKSHYYRSDEKEFKEFESVIGKENMPETLEKFQELKYNKDKKSFEILSGFKDYKKDNPKATKENFETAKRLKEIGLKGKIHIPSQKIETRFFDFNDKHINTEREHNVTRKEAEYYIANSLASITRWEGKRIVYYSESGVTCVDLEQQLIVTAYSVNQFDDKVREIIKELTLK